MSPRTFTKDSTTLTRFLKAMLWILVGITVLSLASNILQLQLLNSSDLTRMNAESNDKRQHIVATINLLTHIITGLLFLMWIYRANLNIHGFSAQNLQFSPGGAAGSYFIPFLNLFWPYRAIKEIWQASKNPDEWRSQSVPPILGWWWALFLIAAFLGQVPSRLAMRATSIAMLSASTTVSIVCNLVDILLCFITLTLVTKIFRMQEELVGRGF